MTRSDLFKEHVKRYQAAVFVIGTNELPLQAAHVQEEQHNTAVLQPLYSRADITYFTYQFLGKTKDEFPYSQVQLAYALDLLCRHPELVAALDELDN